MAPPTPEPTPTAPGTPGPGEEMPAVAPSFETETPAFPLRISQASTQDEVELLLYVLAPYRVTSLNFETPEISESGYNLQADDMEAEYNWVFEQTLAGPTPEQKHHYASMGMLATACNLAGLRWRRRGAATGLLIGLLLALAVA